MGKLYVVILVMGISASGWAAPKPILAVAPSTLLKGISGVEPSAVDESILTAIHGLNAFEVTGQSDIQKLLEAEQQKQQLGCETSESCFAAIAGALGAEFLVSVQVAPAGLLWNIAAKIISPDTAKVVSRTTLAIEPDGAELLDSLPRVVEMLFVPTRILQAKAERENKHQLGWISFGASLLAGGIGAYFLNDASVSGDDLKNVNSKINTTFSRLSQSERDALTQERRNLEESQAISNSVGWSSVGVAVVAVTLSCIQFILAPEIPNWDPAKIDEQ